MANQKITGLPAAAGAQSDDLIELVQNVAAVPESRKAKLQNIIPRIPLDWIPAIPSVWDDDFTTAILDAKWSNPANTAATIVLTQGFGHVFIEPAITSGSGNLGIYGIRQVAPISQSFSIMCKMEDMYIACPSLCGLFVAKTGGNGWIYGPCINSQDFAYAFGFSSYSEVAATGGFAGNINNEQKYFLQMPRSGVWLKIVFDFTAQTLKFHWSSDGVEWILQGTTTGITAIDRIGLGLWGGPVHNHRIGFDWFRVTTP